MKNKNSKLIESIPLFIGVIVVFNLLRNSQKNTTLSNAASDPITQIAIKIRQALNPSGSNWLFGVDGTDEDSLFAIAPTIKGSAFAEVSKQYQLLYGSNITTDLQDELSASSLTKFWAIINGVNAPVPTTPTVNPPTNPTQSESGQVVATKAYNVRSDVSPYPVKFASKVGQIIGKYGGETTINLNGVKTAMYIATITVYVPTGIFGLSWPKTTKYLIAKGGAKIT